MIVEKSPDQSEKYKNNSKMSSLVVEDKSG